MPGAFLLDCELMYLEQEEYYLMVDTLLVSHHLRAALSSYMKPVHSWRTMNIGSEAQVGCHFAWDLSGQAPARLRILTELSMAVVVCWSNLLAM